MHAVPAGRQGDGDFDPRLPVAYPLTGVTDLMGRMPVRLRAEGGVLAAYGFGHQRIAVPATSIGSVQVIRGQAKAGRAAPAVVVLDKSDRRLLRARGTWGDRDLNAVCYALKLRAPQVLATRGGLRQAARWRRAPGSRRLRVRPRGFWLARLAGLVTALTACGLGIAAGIALTLLLPPAIGGVRDLIAVAASVAGVLAALWLFFFAVRLALGALRWLVVSLRAGSPAPAHRFLRVTGANKWTSIMLTGGMALAIPTLAIWGPSIGGASLVHGFHDQALVAELRQDGVTAPGAVTDVPYATDDNGDIQWHDRATLEFRAAGGTRVQTPDPGINGRTWPMDTGQQVTIVYDPADPYVAAVRGQLSGSVWRDAPAGNIIAGALAILAVPGLIWLVRRRVTKGSRRAREEFIAGLA